MWLLVMFDLPVTEKKAAKAASDFRKTLLDLGFEMSQFSNYIRSFTSNAQLQTYCRKIELALPEGGSVQLLQFTDKQFERLIVYNSRKSEKAKTVNQYELF